MEFLPFPVMVEQQVLLVQKQPAEDRFIIIFRIFKTLIRSGFFSTFTPTKINMKKFCTVFFFTSLSILIASCGGESKDKTDKPTNDTVVIDTVPFKIYSLPAPLQIPNAIKGFKTKY